MEPLLMYSYHYRTNNTTTPDPDFCIWINEVESQVFNKITYYLLDLPDENYRMNFENGQSSTNMANIIIKNFDDMANFMLDG